MASCWEALLESISGYTSLIAGIKLVKFLNVFCRYVVRLVWLTVKRRPSWAFVPPRTGMRAMLPERRRCAGSLTNVTLSTTGAEMSVLVLMMVWMVLAFAARTQVRLLACAPGQPSWVVTLFQAMVPSAFGTERYVYWPLCRMAARKGGTLFSS